MVFLLYPDACYLITHPCLRACLKRLDFNPVVVYEHLNFRQRSPLCQPSYKKLTSFILLPYSERKWILILILIVLPSKHEEKSFYEKCLGAQNFSMTNDNCRKFEQNQIIFYICPRVVEDSRPSDCLLYTSRCV